MARLAQDPQSRDLQKALGAAGALNKAAGVLGQDIPYAGLGLGLASLLSNPTSENVAKFAGRALTSPEVAIPAGNYLSQFAPQGAALAAETAPYVSGAASGLLGGLQAAGSGLAFSTFAGGGPLKMLLPSGEPSERLQRRAGRSRDAAGLTGETLRALQSGNLATPIGGSTLGDTLASILNFNLGGSYYGSGAGDFWLPDPTLGPLLQLLQGQGYKGTTVENGQIVRREPTSGDVGGVGEMILGGGFQMRNPRVTRDFILQHGGEDPLKSHTDIFAQGGELGGQPLNLYGAQAWSELLRGISGVPLGATSVFDYTKPAQTGVIQDEGGSTGSLPVGWTGGQAVGGMYRQLDESGNAVPTWHEPSLPPEYLAALGPVLAAETLEKVRTRPGALPEQGYAV